MNGQKRSKPKWVWVAALAVTMSLTGCGMYPSAPGKWPHGIWGSVLQIVSHVIDYFAHYVGYGLALIIVTIIMRLLVLPLMVRQIKFSKSMQQMQPKIAEIRSKHKGDNQKIQQETMKLYQEHGFNPMAGCLPMVIQLPILYALFGAIEGNIKLSHASFLGIFQLGHPDHTFILPVLAGITTFLSSRVMMTGQDTQQKMMLFIMPVFVFFMATRFAAGLSLYWVVSNLFMAGQSYFIRVRPAQALAAAGGGAAALQAADKVKPVRVGEPPTGKGKGKGKDNLASEGKSGTGGAKLAQSGGGNNAKSGLGGNAPSGSSNKSKRKSSGKYSGVTSRSNASSDGKAGNSSGKAGNSDDNAGTDEANREDKP